MGSTTGRLNNKSQDTTASMAVIVFYRYSRSERAEIGKYASQHGVAAAARVYSRKLGKNVSGTTASSLKKAYLHDKSAADDEGILPEKKRGRPVLLGEVLDTKLQVYIKTVREGGGVISARIVMAAARGILMSYNRARLADFGGDVLITRHWAYALLRRMEFVQRKATTSKSKFTPDDFARVKQQFLNDVKTVIVMENIPPELVINWDQTGIKIVPSSTWTMDKRGSKRVEVAGVGDKRMITVTFAGTMVGDFLSPQVIYQGKTNRCHPRFNFPYNWSITHSPKHWANEQTIFEYVEHVIIPYVTSMREYFEPDTPALAIYDNFKGQITAGITDLLESHNIHTCLLPANTTDLLQPMDLSVNKPAKDILKRRFEEWYAQQVVQQLDENDGDASKLKSVDLGLPMLKELGAKWLIDVADYFAQNPQIVVNGFIRAGITSAYDDAVAIEQKVECGSDTEGDFSASDDDDNE